MRFDEVRRAIISEWLALPEKARQTEQQARDFAKRAAKRHAFAPTADPSDLIMRWLRPHIGQR